MNKNNPKTSPFSLLTKKQKVILITLVSLIFLSLLFFILKPSSPPSDTNLIPTLTPTPTSDTTITPTPSVEFSYNTSDEWQQAYDQGLQEYEQQRNDTAEEALSYIRQNSPIKQSDFTIEYSYKNNTYTISLLTTPYTNTKQQVINWFQNQGVPSSILDTLRLQWLEK